MTKDWILANIENIMREKGLKLETVSKEIGISKGEFSKILSEQRKDYPKYLVKIAEILEVD
jgi:lambda repressor-like predicted transcriptional regulator